MQQSSHEGYSIQNNEVSLVEIVKTLIKHSRFIISFTGVVTLLAILYVFSLGVAPSEYIVKSTFTAPSESSVLQINNLGLEDETSGSIHTSFLNNLNNSLLQKKVFIEGGYLARLNNENKSIDNLDNDFSGVLNSISIQLGENIIHPTAKSNKDSSSYLQPNSLSIQGPNDKILIEFLDELVVKANSATVSDYFNIINQIKSMRLEEIFLERQSLLLKAKQERLAEVEVLIFAAKIAKSLGIIENNFNQLSELAKQNNLFFTIDDNPMLPNWYLYGEKSLLERAKLLKERKDDTPYIPKLIGLDLEKRILESSPLDSSIFTSMKLLQPANSQRITTSSKNNLIIALVFLGSLILSVILAMLMNLFKEEETEPTTKASR